MDDCIEWTQSVGSHGYGQTFHEGKVTVAHRVAFIKAHNLEMSDIKGIRVSQACGNRRCVNPEHLTSKLVLNVKDRPEWNSWTSIKQRCLNPNNPAYPRYGGRGITMHPEWIESFESFYNFVGPKPGPEYSLDRIDNDGNYEPGNVQWADPETQNNNKRNNISNQEFCPKGHPWSENLLEHSRSNGWTQRTCRTCKNDYRRSWRASQRKQGKKAT